MGERSDKVAEMVAEELAAEQARANGAPTMPPLVTLVREVGVEVDLMPEPDVSPSAKWRATREHVVKSRDPRREETEPPPPNPLEEARPAGTATTPPPASWDPKKGTRDPDA